MPTPDKSWNLKMVKAREALDMLPKLPAQPDKVDWGDVWIGHADTGFTHNPVFGWPGGQSGILLASRGINYMESGTPPQDPLDYNGFPGHGTRTGSVLAGDLPGTFVGVAPGVPTIPYRVTDNIVLAKKAIRQNLANAIRHAVDANACDVISISLGINMLSIFGGRPLGRAVDYAYENGVIVVAAGGQIIDRVTYPGKFSRSIGVGGVRDNSEVWFRYHEDWKKYIDVWAPGDEVYRANTVLKNGAEDFGFGRGDGTSYGAVHVAGAAAMWLVHREQEIDTKYTVPWKRVEAFRKLIKDTHQPIAGDYQPVDGTGILDIKAVLDANLPDITDDDYVDRKAENEIF